jgi:hypothetical protein
MRVRIGRTFFVSAAVLLCAAALPLIPDTALARSPRPGVVSIFDDLVGAEPGEDPHLRVDADIRVDPIGGLGTSALPDADASGRDLVGRDPVNCRRTGPSRVHSKFLAMLRFFFATTMPR